MTDLNREAFEAYAAEKGWGDCLGRKGENYSDWSVNPMWLAWQASRAALVIELPQEDGMHGHLWAPDVVAAIEAAGVKVKP